MSDDPMIELVRSRLGGTIQRLSFRIAGRDATAYRAPARCERIKPLVPANTRTYYDAQEHELETVACDSELRARNVRFFVGDGGTALYAIPGLPPIDVVEFARVGTHNGRHDEWQDVRQFLLDTVHSVDFDVVFADEAGLDVRLASAVSADVAIDWDRALLDRVEADTRWVDSYTYMLERARDLDPIPGADARGGGRVPAFIVGRKSIRLWWD